MFMPHLKKVLKPSSAFILGNFCKLLSTEMLEIMQMLKIKWAKMRSRNA